MMNEYKAVPSGMELSRRVVDCLEVSTPTGYQPDERVNAIRAVNDILQGRASRFAEELLAELEKCDDPRFPAVREDIQAFLRQKELLITPYDKVGDKQFHCRQRRMNDRVLKVVGQRIYDRAAKAGFPPNFFRETYFDNVTFYSLPDHADFCGSVLHYCKFAVCRICEASFVETKMERTVFYTSVLNYVDFFGATLVYSRFDDCEVSNTNLQNTKMADCYIQNCTMDHINYLGAKLDSCIFEHISTGTIQGLSKATITLNGVTEEECRQNKNAVYRALGVKQVAA